MNAQVQWLTGTDLMPQLLAVLEPGHSADAAKHAAEVLAAVARSALSPLARCMAEPKFLQTLLERAFEEGGPSSVQVVQLTACQGVLSGSLPSPVCRCWHCCLQLRSVARTGRRFRGGSPSVPGPGTARRRARSASPSAHRDGDGSAGDGGWCPGASVPAAPSAPPGGA